MTKLQTVIKTLADTVNLKKKNLNKNTNIVLFNNSLTLENFNETSNTVNLGSTDSTVFLREIESKYNIFFSNDDTNQIISVRETVKLIEFKLKDIKRKNKEDKAAIQDFRFSRHGVEVLSVSNKAEHLAVLGAHAISLDAEFWTSFNKWYSDNRSKIAKKYKPVKTKKPKKVKKDKAPEMATAA